jgi:DNA invertase Pin-like site-specific DNA recombinase
MKAILYGVKSSPDEKGAVDDQLKVIRDALPADRQEVAAFQEENQSGYRKSRGPELERAIAAAIAAARQDGEAELWCWHSSRLARGTGRKGQARALGALFYELRSEGVAIRSALDDPYVTTEEFIGMASRQSAKYAEDLSDWTRQGIQRRRQAGKPVGGLPYGYSVQKVIVDGHVVTRRQIDPITGPILVQIYEWSASGLTPGDIVRRLNAAGVPTARGKVWRAISILDVIDNDTYEGRNGYPAILDGDLAQRARAHRVRADPAAVQRRKGGRPGDDSYVLKGIAFCTCGAPLYTTSRWTPGRAYVCRERMQSSGLCGSRAIPAPMAEERVLEHLTLFVGDVEQWVGEQLAGRQEERQARQRQVDALLAQLAVLDRQRDARMAEIAEHGITSPVAFELVERIDDDRVSLRRDIDDARSALGEWSAQLDANAIVAFYQGLVDLVTGKVANADGAAEVNRALHESLTGVWLAYDGKTLTAEVRLRPTGDDDIDLVAAALVPELTAMPGALALQAPKLQGQPR